MHLGESFDHQARSQPLVRGSFRVVTRDHKGELVIHDFTTFDDARRYADEIASNWSTEHFNAQVFNDNFSMIYEGKPNIDW